MRKTVLSVPDAGQVALPLGPVAPPAPDQAELDLLWRQLLALACVTMQPGSWDKRFVKQNVLFGKPERLSERQANAVRMLAYKYRRQMPRGLVPSRVKLPRGRAC